MSLRRQRHGGSEGGESLTEVPPEVASAAVLVIDGVEKIPYTHVTPPRLLLVSVGNTA